MGDPVHRVLPWLGRFTLACALGGVPAATVMAQGAACDAVGTSALTLREFRKAVDAYAGLLPRPEAASALLVCLRKGHLELAETLMLHQRRLRAANVSDAVVESAFLHYVIYTSQPKLGEHETADLERLARSYRRSLLLAAEPDTDAEASCDAPTWTLARLRCIGQSANRRRPTRRATRPGCRRCPRSRTGAPS